MATPTHRGGVQLERLALNLLCGGGDDAVGVEVRQEQGVDQGRLPQSCGIKHNLQGDHPDCYRGFAQSALSSFIYIHVHKESISYLFLIALNLQILTRVNHTLIKRGL